MLTAPSRPVTVKPPERDGDTEERPPRREGRNVCDHGVTFLSAKGLVFCFQCKIDSNCDATAYAGSVFSSPVERTYEFIKEEEDFTRKELALQAGRQ